MTLDVRVFASQYEWAAPEPGPCVASHWPSGFSIFDVTSRNRAGTWQGPPRFIAFGDRMSYESNSVAGVAQTMTWFGEQ